MDILKILFGLCCLERQQKEQLRDTTVTGNVAGDQDSSKGLTSGNRQSLPTPTALTSKRKDHWQQADLRKNAGSAFRVCLHFLGSACCQWSFLLDVSTVGVASEQDDEPPRDLGSSGPQDNLR